MHRTYTMRITCLLNWFQQQKERQQRDSSLATTKRESATKKAIYWKLLTRMKWINIYKHNKCAYRMKRANISRAKASSVHGKEIAQRRQQSEIVCCWWREKNYSKYRRQMNWHCHLHRANTLYIYMFGCYENNQRKNEIIENSLQSRIFHELNSGMHNEKNWKQGSREKRHQWLQ